MADSDDNVGQTETMPVFVGALELFPTTYPRLQTTHADADCLIDATNDAEAIECWLYAYREKSPNTLAAFRKEAVRYLLWLQIERREALADANQDTVERYSEFLIEPSDNWCGTRRPLGHPQWRPFQKGLSRKSRSDALSVLKTLYQWLSDAGYLRRNPFKLIKSKKQDSVQRRNQQAKSRERVLFADEWQWVLEALEGFPRVTPKQEAAYQRAAFLLNFLYYLGPRVSEVVHSDMGSFRQVDGHWWWYTRGKGGVERKVPLAKAMVKALRLYRLSRNLPPEPVAGETTPLLLSLYGTGVPLSTRKSVYQVVKGIFQQACALTEDEATRQKLEQASTHWIRHTFATRMHQVGIDDATSQSSLGHANRATTEIYTHFEDHKIHEEFDKL